MDGERTVTGVDTYSEISLVDENKARDSWQRIDRESLEIHGVGRATMGDRVTISARMGHGEEETMIEARLCATKHMPRGVDLLIETKTQFRMGMRIDQGNQRLEIKDITAGRRKTRGIAIDLERPLVFRRRMETKPLKVLDLASGSSAAYMILKGPGVEHRKVGSMRNRQRDEDSSAGCRPN